MSEEPNRIKFDPKTAIQVREPLVNAYGFDLTDENAIGFQTGKLRFIILGFRATTHYDTLIATIIVCLQPHIADEYTYVGKLNLYDHERLMGYSRTAAFQLKIAQEEIKTGLC